MSLAGSTRSPHIAIGDGFVSELAGVLMIGYIVVAVVILNQPARGTTTEVVCFAGGLVMALVGYAVWRA